MAEIKTVAFLNVFESKLENLIIEIKQLKKAGNKEKIKQTICEAKKLRKTVRSMQKIAKPELFEKGNIKTIREIESKLYNISKLKNQNRVEQGWICALRWVLNNE